jgi:hypothetical protein
MRGCHWLRGGTHDGNCASQWHGFCSFDRGRRSALLSGECVVWDFFPMFRVPAHSICSLTRNRERPTVLCRACPLCRGCPSGGRLGRKGGLFSYSCRDWPALYSQQCPILRYQRGGNSERWRSLLGWQKRLAIVIPWWRPAPSSRFHPCLTSHPSLDELTFPPPPETLDQSTFIAISQHGGRSTRRQM